MISRFRATNLPSKEPCTSASSVVLSPLKTPPSLMITFGQSTSLASILPWTISRLQEVISPLTDAPGPMIRVRTSASLSDRVCDPASWGVEEKTAVGGSSVVFQKGSVGFRRFWSACSAGLIVFPSSRPEDPTGAAGRVCDPNIRVTPTGIPFDLGLLLVILNDQLSFAAQDTGADNAHLRYRSGRRIWNILAGSLCVAGSSSCFAV